MIYKQLSMQYLDQLMLNMKFHLEHKRDSPYLYKKIYRNIKILTIMICFIGIISFLSHISYNTTTNLINLTYIFAKCTITENNGSERIKIKAYLLQIAA